MDCDADADTSHVRVLPDTCVELFVNFTSTPVAIIGDQLYKRSIISFRMSRSIDVQMRKGAGCLAICFHPGMAYPFFRIPMHAFTDTTANLSDIWQGMAGEIEDRLSGVCTNETRVDIAQKYLLRRLAGDKPDLQVAYESGYYDQAHFNRDYKAYTGHTPGEVAHARDIFY